MGVEPYEGPLAQGDTRNGVGTPPPPLTSCTDEGTDSDTPRHPIFPVRGIARTRAK
jgi:hypothetical protein